MHKSLIEGIRNSIGSDQDPEEVLSSYYIHEDVKKNTILLNQGEVCRKHIYINHGLLKSYYVGEDFEHILNFYKEGWIAGDPFSLYTGLPSMVSIKAMEDSNISYLTPERKEVLLKDFPELNEIYLQFILNNIRSSQERILSNIALNGEKRYLQFLDKYPDLIRRVPQYQIASYLGITPEFLSKIRRKITDANI